MLPLPRLAPSLLPGVCGADGAAAHGGGGGGAAVLGGCQHPQPGGISPRGGCRNTWPRPSPGMGCGIDAPRGCAAAPSPAATRTPGGDDGGLWDTAQGSAGPRGHRAGPAAGPAAGFDMGVGMEGGWQCHPALGGRQRCQDHPPRWRHSAVESLQRRWVGVQPGIPCQQGARSDEDNLRPQKRVPRGVWSRGCLVPAGGLVLRLSSPRGHCPVPQYPLCSLA